MSYINGLSNAGTRASGVVDFNAAGEAAMSVTIGGVVYLEADAEDLPNGVWTNGATAATSATSLAAAINGDTRQNPPKVSALVSVLADSVSVVADSPGSDGNLTVTTDSGANCTVENMHGGVDKGRLRTATVNYVVTAQDVLADECNVFLPFTPSNIEVSFTDATGLTKAVTALPTIQASPDRVRVLFAGATDPAATDVISVTASE